MVAQEVARVGPRDEGLGPQDRLGQREAVGGFLAAEIRRDEERRSAVPSVARVSSAVPAETGKNVPRGERNRRKKTNVRAIMPV